ncbi:MAG: ABC transporter ATP-binding protein [Verrucomicrobiota bacterium]
MAIITCTDLCFRYSKSRVLDDVTFSVDDGESLAIIGPNGGGKSTLLKILLGLENPESGQVEVFGKSPGQGRKSIGYVPQAMRFDPLYPITAIDIVLMGRLDRLGVGRFSKRCRQAALDSLAAVNLEGFEKRPFSALSGGERQRVMIARALATEPKLLLLDEPPANIDLSIEEQFMETLADLKKQMTVLLVTHDLELVSELGDSVLCVNRRVHRHSLPLGGDIIRAIYSGSRRIEHDRETRHSQGDHSSCSHD